MILPIPRQRRSFRMVGALLLLAGSVSCSGTKQQHRGAQAQGVPLTEDFLYDGDYGVGVPFSPTDSRGSVGRTQPANQSYGMGNGALPLARGVDQPYAAPIARPQTPQAQVPAARSKVAAARSHKVRPGDSLWRISQQYGTSVPALMAANSLSSDVIRVGSVLAIP